MLYASYMLNTKIIVVLDFCVSFFMINNFKLVLVGLLTSIISTIVNCD